MIIAMFILGVIFLVLLTCFTVLMTLDTRGYTIGKNTLGALMVFILALAVASSVLSIIHFATSL